MVKEIIDRIINDNKYSRDDIKTLLKCSEEDTEILFSASNSLREKNFGDEIYLRGIIEFSNYCAKHCHYCGIGAGVDDVERYRIPTEEILETCKKMEANGITTVVLQSGEDPYYTAEKIAELLDLIKENTSLAVTLSLGERDKDTYRLWKEHGADRYLIRFETSNIDLFKSAHPDDEFEHRIECIKTLQEVGIQTGSGLLIGLPGESVDQLVNDILFCTELGLDMIGVGPFISSPNTVFGSHFNPFNKEIYYKTIAILRLLNPKAHIPATTAFDAIDKKTGRNKLLRIGANVFMPNMTPVKYRESYMLYPDKPCVNESSDECIACIKGRLKGLGRKIGEGPGHSILK